MSKPSIEREGETEVIFPMDELLEFIELQEGVKKSFEEFLNNRDKDILKGKPLPLTIHMMVIAYAAVMWSKADFALKSLEPKKNGGKQ